jgi:site-specific recombinase, phage integrase family
VGRIEQAPRVQNPPNDAGSRTRARCFSLSMLHGTALFRRFQSSQKRHKRSDIKGDYMEVTTVKTSDSLIIELNDHSRAILEKYKDVEFENDKALPVITNQKMNDKLKELAELAEINDPVHQTYYKGNERIDEVIPKYALRGTHARRRTFICNALALGIPPQVVMKRGA